MEENDNNNVPKYRTIRSIIEHQIRLREARQLREAMGYQPENNAPDITPAPRPMKQSKTIKDYILLQDEKQKERLLSVLHLLLDDKKGKMTALVILVCVDMGLMEKPPHGALKQEFHIKGNKSGHNTYVAGGLKGYTKEEINGIKTRLEGFKIAINSQE